MKKVIGLGGVARSGKDTFAAILKNKMQQAGYSTATIALAGPLKAHCDPFLKSNLGISAFTSNSEEKSLIRPFLVWYGDAKRKQTSGRFWIELASNTINSTKHDCYIVTDVRYSYYEKDELHWIKNEWNGTLCHVSKYTMFGNPFKPDHKLFVEPANEHEAINDPKIKSAADHIVEWEHVETQSNSPEELLLHPTLNDCVDKFIDKFKLLS